MFNFVDTPNTRQAKDILFNHTQKPLIIEDLNKLKLTGKDYSVSDLGVSEERDDKIYIWLSDQYPEAVFLHEILHVILRYQGYPQICINRDFVKKHYPAQVLSSLKNFQIMFASTIEHPEVFRRLEQHFSIDLNKYFDLQVKQQHKRINSKLNKSITANSPPYYLFRQQDILFGLDYFLWGERGKELLALINEQYPLTYQSCCSLFDKIKKTGFTTPDAAHQSAQTVKDHLIEFGQINFLSEYYNNIWVALDIIKND